MSEKYPKRAFDIFTRLDDLMIDLQKSIDALTEAITGKPPVEGAPTFPSTVFTIPKLPNCYHIFTLNTATAHTDYPIGLKDLLKSLGVDYATYFTIDAVGGGFSYKVNSTEFGSYVAAAGDEWTDFELTEIYITNLAVAGTLQIYVEYRVE